MTWNYRVVRRVLDDTETFEIFEVYYDNDDKVTNWTNVSTSPYGESLGELVTDIDLMQRATKEPVLEWTELPGGPGVQQAQ